MSFEKYGFMSYIGSSRRADARGLCYYLGRIERESGRCIDTEYERDRCASLLGVIKVKMSYERRNDKKAFATLKQMQKALKKYTAFRQRSSKPTPEPRQEISVTLSEELEQQLSRVDWSSMDTMIGTVRDSVQLDYILEHNCYYAPERYISRYNLPIQYIALYEQGIGTEPGIRLFGKVLAVRKVKRSRIGVPTSRDNSNELYYLFRVRYWDILPVPVSISGTQRGRPAFTNKFLLDNCKRSYQLFSISSEEEFRLMTLIDRLLCDRNDESVYRINDSYTLSLSQDAITVTDRNNNTVDRITVGSFLYNPRDKFERIKEALEITSVKAE